MSVAKKSWPRLLPEPSNPPRKPNKRCILCGRFSRDYLSVLSGHVCTGCEEIILRRPPRKVSAVMRGAAVLVEDDVGDLVNKKIDWLKPCPPWASD